MGTKGREIVDMPVDQIINLLNCAYADEWLAHYQYWLGSRIVRGPMKETVGRELQQHSEDELRHADLLAARIIQLGGVPISDPRDWMNAANCKYYPPTEQNMVQILSQNIEGEQCAIGVYKNIVEVTDKKDPVTHDLARQILREEVEHEEDLEGLKHDLALMQHETAAHY